MTGFRAGQESELHDGALRPHREPPGGVRPAGHPTAVGPAERAGRPALTAQGLLQLQAGPGNAAVSRLVGSGGRPVQRALTRHNLTDHYATATTVFEQLIANDALYQLTNTAPQLFRITVRGVPDEQNKAELGDTTISYLQTGQVVYSSTVNHLADVTPQLVGQRGLAVTITLNSWQGRSVGAILQVLTHEYGGHVEPFAPYLIDLVNGGFAVGMVGETGPWRSLSGGRHHADLALGQSAGYNRLRGLAAGSLHGRPQGGEELGDFFDREEEDRESQLNKTWLALLFGAASSGSHDVGISLEDSARLLTAVSDIQENHGHLVSNTHRQAIGANLRKPPAVEPPLTPAVRHTEIPREWRPF
jgi:hypothetical protein